MRSDRKKPTGNSIVGGILWKFAERGLSQVVSFVISIILARILDPQDYGLVAMVTVFTLLANVFITSGFSAALIQKKDADEEDFSTVFWCTLAMSIVIYWIMFALAPAIAAFYGENVLVDIVRVYSIVIVISAFYSVQDAFIARHMMFRKVFISTLAGTLVSGAVGIGLALAGFGVWALVFQSLINISANTLVLFVIAPWAPRRLFSLASAKKLIDYGWKILFADLIGTVYNNIRQLLVGKLYTANDLAFYSQGQKIPDLVCNNLETSVFSVLFPAMSNLSDDAEALKALTRKAARVVTYLVFPVIAGIISAGGSIIEVLLTEKWVACVPYMQIIAASRMVDLMGLPSFNAIKSYGRSDVILKIEFITKPVSFLIIAGAAFVSIEAVAWSCVFCSAIRMIANVAFCRGLIGYEFVEQARDLVPALLLSAAMGMCVALVPMILSASTLVILVVQIVLGITAYIAGSWLVKLDAFLYVKGKLKYYLAS